jgi:hypothetical protein
MNLDEGSVEALFKTNGERLLTGSQLHNNQRVVIALAAGAGALRSDSNATQSADGASERSFSAAGLRVGWLSLTDVAR